MLAATVLSNHPALAIQWGVVLLASLLAAGWDVRTRRIPNWLTGLLLLSGVVQAMLAARWAGLGDALAGCLLLGVPYVVLFIFAGGGAGDAKMMGALGAWLGFSNGVMALLAVSICGAVLGIAYAMIKGKAAPALRNVGVIAMASGLLIVGQIRVAHVQAAIPKEEKMLPMPYGLAILAGMCVALGGRLLWHI
jgi:prepilin peptidase CpaA